MPAMGPWGPKPMRWSKARTVAWNARHNASMTPTARSKTVINVRLWRWPLEIMTYEIRGVSFCRRLALDLWF